MDDDLLVSTPGRPEAFGEFSARHEAAILGFMLRRTGDPELAADERGWGSVFVDLPADERPGV